jgi:hypothetical protein
MTTRLSRGPLLPQIIALSLFSGGLFFALILLPLTALLAFNSDGWGGCAYFIFGYLVYFGWFWRAWHTPSKVFALLLWLMSFAQNSLPWFSMLKEDHWHLPALHGFETDGMPDFGAVMFGWWLVASVLSVVALICEFLPRRPMPNI